MRADSDCLVGCRIRRGRLGFVAVTVAILMTTVVVLPTQAGYIVTLEQVGSNVVATGTGAIDLSGLTFFGVGSSLAFVAPISGNIFTGPEPPEVCDDYTGVTGPTSFGGGGVTLASSGSGDRVGMQPNVGTLFVPHNYVSNTPLLSSSTWNNVTLSSLGATPGTYVWSWGNGSNQDCTLQVGAVPEPGTLFLLALGVLMLIVVKLRRLSSNAPVSPS
jgi:hypothetical protein